MILVILNSTFNFLLVTIQVVHLSRTTTALSLKLKSREQVAFRHVKETCTAFHKVYLLVKTKVKIGFSYLEVKRKIR